MPTPNEIGDDLERRGAKYLHGQRIAQSGGGKIWKLDFHSGRGLLRFIWSAKATTKSGIRITASMLHEARRAARGLQGRGDNFEPGIIFGVDGEDEPWVALPVSTLAAVLTQAPDVAYIEPSKAAVRRARIDHSPLG